MAITLCPNETIYEFYGPFWGLHKIIAVLNKRLEFKKVYVLLFNECCVLCF